MAKCEETTIKMYVLHLTEEEARVVKTCTGNTIGGKVSRIAGNIYHSLPVVAVDGGDDCGTLDFSSYSF